MPTDFTISTVTCNAASSQFDTTPTCSMTSSTRTITIQSMTSSTIAALTVITMTVDSIRNPCTTAKTGAITMNIYDASSNILVTGTYSISAKYYTYSTITAFTVTPANTTAGARGVSYTFSVTPKSRMPLKSTIIITLPTDVTVLSAT